MEAGGLGREMARDAARVRELAEELLEARLIIRDVGADLTVGAVEQGLRGARGTAVPGPHEEDGVLAVVGDQAVHVAEQEVDARGGAPMAHQAMLDVDAAEIALLPRLGIGPIGAHERIGAKVDLTDGQVVGATPVLIHAGKRLRTHRTVELGPRGADHGLSHGLFLPRKGGTSFRLSNIVKPSVNDKTFYRK